MQINIDDRADKHITGFTNYVSFNDFMMRPPSRIDELQINGGVLNTLSLKDFLNVFTKILPNLGPGSILHIESLDINLFAHAVSLGGIGLDEVNAVLFDKNIKGVYNLIALEHLLTQNGLETHAKGYDGLRFHLTMHRP